jgi:isochorismate synthase
VISRLEDFDRRFYAGLVGWVDARGDGEWAITLRCAEITGSAARLHAGAGIVTGSEPAAEDLETEAKFGPMLRALGVLSAED